MKVTMKCPHCGKESEHEFNLVGESLIELWDNPEDEMWDNLKEG